MPKTFVNVLYVAVMIAMNPRKPIFGPEVLLAPN
jgi:hypothetical protein